MEQRRLRLGDILDDYCPRERRLTNHAVVAMIEEDVKQTRCTTCDAEHAYKGGKVPRRRKKDSPAALYKEVLAGLPDADGIPVLAAGPIATDVPLVLAADTENVPDALVPESATEVPVEPPTAPVTAIPAAAAAAEEEVADVDIEEGPVHRPLIRAQLPRIEGQKKEERRLPEFTIRQSRGGNGHFRGGDPRIKQQRPGGSQPGNGNRPHGGARFAGPRPPGPGRGQPGRGPAAGFRSGPPRPGGGKKRSR